ncbi:M23 family metallopeptidase [Streptomyces griseus]|uniref:M23 family metallopeptidase n=1 Tax=Streptomyces griseus TaxID=1911 RepID=UPI00055F53EB|nr:M23 family metallopeptidase [Streptomyces griseus]
MRSFRRHPWLIAVLVCAAAVLAARPATGDGDAGYGSEADLSVQVSKLYADAAVATERYEEGRHAADVQAAEAKRLERLLDRERRELAVHHEELGRIARAQYRDSGGLPVAAQIILAGSPDELMRGQQVFSRQNMAVANALGKSRRAEARLSADERRAATAWQTLERRRAELDGIKKGIEEKLEQARWQLQGQANASVAAGSCRGAARLEQPLTQFTTAWVAPVEGYELSAGFGSGGARWAHRHTGQDFAVPIGTPVRAVGPGRVLRVSCGGAFGIEIVVEHDGGYYTQYAHLAAVTVDQGDRVATGQWIGQSGTTGNSTGPHLHFEVRVTPYLGSSVDPVPWLRERGVSVG